MGIEFEIILFFSLVFSDLYCIFFKLTLTIVVPYTVMTGKLISQRLFRSVTSPNRLCRTPSITCTILLGHLPQIRFFSWGKIVVLVKSISHIFIIQYLEYCMVTTQISVVPF